MHANDSGMKPNLKKELIFKKEVYEIVSCAFEVMNEIGHGFREKTYERALVREFELRGIECESQKEFPVYYKESKIDVIIPDLIVFEMIIVDTKTIERITDSELGQMLNYLRITNLPVGVIINFKNPKVEWRRVVLGETTEENLNSFESIRGS